MVHALYRKFGTRRLLPLGLPGNEIDFGALDRASESKWGRTVERIAAWLRS